MLALLLAAGNSAAAGQAVPSPGTPLRAYGSRIHCWGRELRVTRLLPDQIRSQGEPLLAGPVRLRVDGRAVRISRRRGFNRQARRIAWTADAGGSGLPVRAVASVEYDGFCEFDLALGAGLIRSLALEIPVASRAAQFLHFVNESHYQ